MKAIAVVGARLNSSRLPAKHLLDLAGKPMIARIFERLDAVPNLEQAVLATTSDPYNRALVEWARAAGRPVLAYEGDVNDLVGRVDAAFQASGADVLVYICGDCPLIDPRLICNILDSLDRSPQAQYVQIEAHEGRGVIHQGIDIFRGDLWRRIVSASSTPAEREHVGSARKKFIDQVPFCSLAEPECYHSSQQRISVDTPTDYQFMREVYERWYREHPSDTLVSLSWLIELLHRDPRLAAINAEVHQKSVGEVSEPIVLVCGASAKLGLGHVRRMLVLAAALVDRHAAGVRLLIEGDVPDLEDLRLLPHAGCSDLFRGLDDLIAAKKPKSIVFDLPKTRLADQRAHLETLAAQGIDLVSVDGAIPWDSVFRIDYVPSFYLRPERVMERRFSGWHRYLLTEAQPADPTRSKLLVLTGGSDVYQLGQIWPEELDRNLPASWQVTWVQGPFAPPPRLPDQTRLHWQVRHNPSDLAELMAQSGHALSVYGVSLFECLTHGLACTAFLPESLDPLELLAFRDAGLARCASNPGLAVKEACELAEDRAGAIQLGRSARARMAGRGAVELAQMIMAP